MSFIWMYVFETLDNFNSFLQYTWIIKSGSVYKGFHCLMVQWNNIAHLALVFDLVQDLEHIKEFRKGNYPIKETGTVSLVSRPQISK